MSDSAIPLTHYRCTCPHCQKVIKIRTDWAGKNGICPHCRKALVFPPFKAPSSASATTQELLRLVAPDDNSSLNEGRSDGLALLLSQATCRDYELANKLLESMGGGISARQWRKTLNASAQRESMRLRFEQRLGDQPETEMSAAEPVAILAASDASEGAVAPDAWKILARFLYFQRHGSCDECKTNPTGLRCIYLHFDAFLAARDIPESRAVHWQKLLHHHLGL